MLRSLGEHVGGAIVSADARVATLGLRMLQVQVREAPFAHLGEWFAARRAVPLAK